MSYEYKNSLKNILFNLRLTDCEDILLAPVVVAMNKMNIFKMFSSDTSC